ncbi:MAG: T9SS type A sorting domain-containing protein [Bacteroidota bacterium]|jgi:hypothetical protein
MRKYIVFIVSLILLVCSTAKQNLNAQDDKPSVKINELEKDNLPTFGISLEKTGATLLFSSINLQSADERGISGVVSIRKLALSANKIETKNVKHSEYEKASKLIPNLIVITSENKTAAYFNNLSDYLKSIDGKNNLSEQSENVVAVNAENWLCYHFKIQTAGKKTSDIYLWYDSTDNLINNLPANLKPANDPENIPIEGLPSALSDLKFFPNPVSNGAANLSFRLSEPRTTEINLYDISGKLIQAVIPPSNLYPKAYQYPVDLNNVPDGMYLLAVTTTRYDKLVIRIIVIKN